MKKYVCVLATNDYLNGCLVLNENLKHLNSQYELLCLINEEITEETKKILDYFKNTFDKLSIFKLTEYEKLVYLDLDLLLLQNIDDLFCYNGIAMARDFPFSNLHNSGVMVIEPDKNDYDGLIKLMVEKMNNQEQLGDQDIINEYFDVIHTLPQSYNLMRRITEELETSKLPIWDDKLDIYKVNVHANSDDAKILHYIINPKPFSI